MIPIVRNGCYILKSFCVGMKVVLYEWQVEVTIVQW
jgi:hypothetical protein